MSLLEVLGHKQAPSRQFYDEESDSSELDFLKSSPSSFQPTQLFNWQWDPSLTSSTSHFLSKPLFIGEDIFSKVMLTFLKTSQAFKIAKCTFQLDKPLGSTSFSIDFYCFNDCIWFTLPSFPHSIPFEFYTPLYLTIQTYLSPSECISFTCLSNAPFHASAPTITYLSNLSPTSFNQLVNKSNNNNNPNFYFSSQLLTSLPLENVILPFQEPMLLSRFASTFLVQHPSPMGFNQLHLKKESHPSFLPSFIFIVQVNRKLGYPDLDPSLDSKWKLIFQSFSFYNSTLQDHWLNAIQSVRHQLEMESPLYI